MSRVPSTRTAAFTAERLTKTVFKIEEYDDIYDENPFIYAKVLPSVVVILDTGCGGNSKSPHEVTALREFIEAVPVATHNNKPLNQGGRKDYIVVCSHCHYDHILGTEQFARDSQILASSNSPSFLSPKNLPESSLCARLGITTPQYTPTLVPHLAKIMHGSDATGLQVLHTPGHTPDELALWDEGERMLYVGDTVYEQAPIIFPPQGNITDWFTSMDFLIDFVEKAQKVDKKRVMINAGHITSMQDASDVLVQARSFMRDVLTGKEELKDRFEIGGIMAVYYRRADGRFSLRCPEKLVEDARNKLALGNRTGSTVDQSIL